MISEYQARTENIFHENGCSVTIGPRGGRKEKIRIWRRNGSTKVWKKTNRYHTPLKSGFRLYDYIEPGREQYFHMLEDCPVKI